MIQVTPEVSGAAVASVIMQAAAATSFAKILVDVSKLTSIHTPPWVLPILAMIYGELCALALYFTQSGISNISVASMSGVFLVGIMAGGGAIGVTELGRTADK